MKGERTVEHKEGRILIEERGWEVSNRNNDFCRKTSMGWDRQHFYKRQNKIENTITLNYSICPLALIITNWQKYYK